MWSSWPPRWIDPPGGDRVPQEKEFKYLGVLFRSHGKMEIDRRIGAAVKQDRTVW